jgi:Right handed beta helix region
MTTYYIDPTAAAGGNGTLQHPYASWTQVTWTSGSTYLQKVGTTYAGTVDVLGSEVTISSYGTGAAPQVEGVYFSGASHDLLSNFTIKGNNVADVVFANGAISNTVSDSDISASNVGVLFATGAGASNLVWMSTIHDNSLFGIDATQGTLGEYVLNNSIYNNGSDGVELEGNGTTISYNDIYNNSTLVPGSSGIHTYAASSSADGGSGNVVSYNIVSGTHDNGYGDGNGIEIDQWSHGNVVLGNILYDNDGAGIVAYGTYNNQFVANASFSNQMGIYADHGIHGELDFISELNNDNPTYGNSVSMNIVDAASAYATDLYLDSNSSGNQTIGTNFLGGSSGMLSSSQFEAVTSSWYSWWSSQGVPSTVLTTGYAALVEMISF